MLISRTSQYAIQALICIGMLDDDKLTSVRDIARWLDVPSPYLAKILQTLCKDGLLDSNRGRQGGFGLRKPADHVNLLQVLAILEHGNLDTECLLGLKECGDETACPVHVSWKPIKEKIRAMLESQTLAVLASAVKQGKYRLSELPVALIMPLIPAGTPEPLKE